MGATRFEAPIEATGRGYTHRKEYVRWITEAKRDETRQKRLRRAIEMLQGGVKTPDSG